MPANKFDSTLRSYSKKYKKRRKEKRGHKLDGARGRRWRDLSKEIRLSTALRTQTSPFLFENSMILPLPGTSSSRHPRRILDFRHSLSRDFPLLSSSTPPVTARHCLQAPVCTYVYNNVTHIPRPRLFLLFRVAARGSKAGTARGRPGFDNRADVQDRDDKRGKEGGSEPCRGRYSMYIYMKKVKGKKGKERNRYLTLLWTDRTEGFT